MPQSNLHLDILEGRDEILDVADFFRMSFPRRVSSGGLSTADFQTFPPTHLWTSMQIWSESCRCDAPVGSPTRLVLLGVQLDGRPV
jgi:hypothetical protein